uniref:Uncharacterized protein n=1 Tax=Cucumis melo TaxID=3656 RepID=A0A9I9DSH1_CUCME
MEGGRNEMGGEVMSNARRSIHVAWDGRRREEWMGDGMRLTMTTRLKDSGGVELGRLGFYLA